MKVVYMIFTFILIINNVTYSNIKPTISYDQSTGNYIIKYEGYDGQMIEVIYEPATKIIPITMVTIKFNSVIDMFQYDYIIENS